MNMLFIRDSKHKGLLIIAGVIALCIGIFFVLNSYIYNETQTVTADNYQEAKYLIEGEWVTLGGNTRYFGNELITDLNDDGHDDVVFIITHEPGGSGTFYYAVAARSTEDGYLGSDGYMLGDRIAPQSIELSQNPRHVNVVVVNYADRAPGDPMTAQPSVGKSVYLKLDPQAMQWGIVEPDFEGESDEPLPAAESWGTIRGTVLLGPTCPVVMDPPDPTCADKLYETSLAITTIDQSRVMREVRSNAQGVFRVDLPAGTYAIRSAAVAHVLPYCSVDQVVVPINESVEVTVYCDSGIR